MKGSSINAIYIRFNTVFIIYFTLLAKEFNNLVHTPFHILNVGVRYISGFVAGEMPGIILVNRSGDGSSRSKSPFISIPALLGLFSSLLSGGDVVKLEILKVFSVCSFISRVIICLTFASTKVDFLSINLMEPVFVMLVKVETVFSGHS